MPEARFQQLTFLVRQVLQPQGGIGGDGIPTGKTGHV
jgi:hypothetical protein